MHIFVTQNTKSKAYSVVTSISLILLHICQIYR